MTRSRLLSRAALSAGGLAVALLAAIAVGQLVSGRRAEHLVESPSGAAYVVPDPEFGYAPAPGVTVRSTRRRQDRVLYDVRYRIGDDGLRRTPGSGTSGPAIVLFGGSYTFGEGVEDDETMPAQLASALHDGTRVLNAGFHGYGPQQMLRSLETGRLDERVPEGVEHVVYQGIPSHVKRAAGRIPWEPGPAYEIGEDGVRFAGPRRSAAVSLATRALNRFELTRTALAAWLAAGPAEERADADLLVETVVRAAELARQKWKARFTVVWWDGEGDPLADRLEARGLDVLRVTDAFEGRSWKLFLLDDDSHPNERGHRAIARALARHVRQVRREARRSPHA